MAKTFTKDPNTFHMLLQDRQVARVREETKSVQESRTFIVFSKLQCASRRQELCVNWRIPAGALGLLYSLVCGDLMTSAWRRAVPNQVFVGQPMIKRPGAVSQGDESSQRLAVRRDKWTHVHRTGPLFPHPSHLMVKEIFRIMILHKDSKRFFFTHISKLKKAAWRIHHKI